MAEEVKQPFLKACYHTWRHFCHEHHLMFRKMEQVGNIAILGGVVTGIHELEIWAAGSVVVVLVIVVTLADEV